jgi:hypothetical protein
MRRVDVALQDSSCGSFRFELVIIYTPNNVKVDFCEPQTIGSETGIQVDVARGWTLARSPHRAWMSCFAESSLSAYTALGPRVLFAQLLLFEKSARPTVLRRESRVNEATKEVDRTMRAA